MSFIWARVPGGGDGGGAPAKKSDGECCRTHARSLEEVRCARRVRSNFDFRVTRQEMRESAIWCVVSGAADEDQHARPRATLGPGEAESAHTQVREAAACRAAGRFRRGSGSEQWSAGGPRQCTNARGSITFSAKRERDRASTPPARCCVRPKSQVSSPLPTSVFELASVLASIVSTRNYLVHCKQ